MRYLAFRRMLFTVIGVALFAPRIATPAAVTKSFPGAANIALDNDGAVGPNHFAELSNLALTSYDKISGQVVQTRSIDALFSQSIGTTIVGAFDPRIQYDHSSQRWFAIGADDNSSGDSAILLAVSTGTDPTGTWKGLRVKADLTSTHWADFPVLGLDADGIYISSKLARVSDGVIDMHTLLSIPKADLLLPAPSSGRLSRINTSSISQVQPQIDVTGSSSDGQVRVGFFVTPPRLTSDCTLIRQMRTMDVIGSEGASAALGNDVTFSDSVTVSTMSCIPGNAGNHGRQNGTNVGLVYTEGDTLYRYGNYLYSVTKNVGAAQPLPLFGLQWAKVDATTHEIVDMGFLGRPDVDFLDPSIAANSVGDVVISYTATGSSEFASSYAVVGRLDNMDKLAFGVPILLKAGSEIYDVINPSRGAARWSDYSNAVTVDPVDDRRFWVTSAYVSARNQTSSWINELFLARSDFNRDGRVNVDDLAILRTGFGSSHAARTEGDADGDFDVDGADFLIWQREVGNGAAPAEGIPEPSGDLLLGLGAMSLLGCKRRPGPDPPTGRKRIAPSALNR